jgi:hypothetical protein
MDHWEYLVLDKDRYYLELDGFGELGWELVAVDEELLYLKRRAPE